MTNLMWARVSALGDVKASGSWMYAAKLPGEGARMYNACGALKEAVRRGDRGGEGLAVNGGEGGGAARTPIRHGHGVHDGRRGGRPAAVRAHDLCEVPVRPKDARARAICCGRSLLRWMIHFIMA